MAAPRASSCHVSARHPPSVSPSRMDCSLSLGSVAVSKQCKGLYPRRSPKLSPVTVRIPSWRKNEGLKIILCFLVPQRIEAGRGRRGLW